MKQLIKITKFLISSYFEDYKYFDDSLSLDLSKQEKMILENIRSKGYFVWKNFIDHKECENLILEVNRLITNKEFLKEYNSSDYRIYGGNFLSSSIKKFNENLILEKIGSAFLKMKTKAMFTLTAKVKFTESNLGSGQGWHRDTVKPYQFKTLLYLSNVNEDNGPFQILDGTNKKFSLFENLIKFKFSFNKNRFNESEINKMQKEKKIITFTANKGDLIIFNSYCIHRGSPLKNGNRYALTNYYFPENFISNNLEKLINKFKLPYKK